ncbi:MAG: hypothetical protein CMP63_06270 [Flavobacteriales bacterium]|nr:hypothetical protein [Flavobacteriales bacterium]
MHVESDGSIEESKITFLNNNKFTEVLIKYPKIKNKLPVISKILKVKRYKYYYNYGLDVLKSKGFTPDLVHCNVMNPVGLIAKNWKQKYNTPYIITEHWTGFLSSDGRYSKSTLLKFSLPSIANAAEKILPVSLDLQEALMQNNLGKKFQIVHNVVNTDKFYPQNKTKNKFLVVADLENTQKNILGIVNAFKVFSATNSGITLNLVGGGGDEALIIEYINQHNLSEKIHLHGRISAEEINNLLAESYASILFSNYENLPCVIVEAFAAGTPFISTNVGGVKEIINEERGILIPSGDEIALVDAMRKVLHTDWNQDDLRNYAINTFSYEKIGQEFDTIYKEIIGA